MPGPSYQFGSFRLNPDASQLSGAEGPIPLAPKVFETLLLLVENNGKTVTKDELLRRVWPDTFVEENSLARNISTLRRALGDGENGSRFILTVPKRGYRFVEEVEVLKPNGTHAVPATMPSAPVPDALQPRSARVWRPWLWLALAVVIVVALAGYLVLRQFSTSNIALGHQRMLAVLPVENLTGDPAQEYVADGLTEEIIAQLGGMNPQSLGVIARTSSMAYKQSSKTARQIGRELGVDYILETSLRESGSSIRFTAQLIRAKDETHLWAKSFEQSGNDLVALEGEVSRAVAQEVELQLTPAAKGRMERALVVKPDSHQLYLEGRYHWNQRTKHGLEKGLEYFQKAAQADPANARAYAGIADSYNLLVFYGYSPGSASILEAVKAAQKAIELDGSLPEGHAALGYSNLMFLWHWGTAEKEFKQAIALDDNYAPAHHWYALFLAIMGRKNEALREIRMAQRLDPVSPIVNTAVGFVDHLVGNETEAIGSCRAVLAANPDFMVAHDVLGRAYEQKGMREQAVAEFEKTNALSANSVNAYLADLAYAQAVSGNRPAAEQLLEGLSDRAKGGAFVGQSLFALVYVALTANEKAIEALQRGQAQNDAGMIWLRVDRRFDPIRGDPRFQSILRDQDARR